MALHQCSPSARDVQIPTDFYSYLSGQPLSSAAISRFASTAALSIAAAVAAAVMLAFGA